MEVIDPGLGKEMDTFSELALIRLNQLLV
jgi:hypothetical protein